MLVEFQEIYLYGDSEYRETISKTYLDLDKIASITPIEVRGIPKKIYGVKLIDGLFYKGHCTYFDTKILLYSDKYFSRQ